MRILLTKILKLKTSILVLCFAVFHTPTACSDGSDWLLPISATDRKTWNAVQLTRIGFFGEKRKAREGIPAHLHTGIDIKRPGRNYDDGPVYAASRGNVISVRHDDPYAQVIIEHIMPLGGIVWTVYEHIAGITVSTGDGVSAYTPIGRFMNREELDKFGWQFDHLHFEILKHRPRVLKLSAKTPYRFYGTFSLECYTPTDLGKYYHNPIDFLDSQWNKG
jgi:murein DD-endopeptidase MepM/ murein hydrolase activator NlpD